MSKLDTPCKQTSETTQGGGGGEAGEGNRREYLLLLGMCRWPFGTPSPV